MNNKQTVYYRILLIKIPEGAALGVHEGAVGMYEGIIEGVREGALVGASKNTMSQRSLS